MLAKIKTALTTLGTQINHSISNDIKKRLIACMQENQRDTMNHPYGWHARSQELYLTVAHRSNEDNHIPQKPNTIITPKD